MSSFALFGLISLITIFVWYYFRNMAPYLKLPCCYSFGMRLIFGTFKGQSIRLNFLPNLEKMCKDYEKDGIVTIWVNVYGPTVVVFDPEAVKKILNEPAAMSKPKIEEVFKSFLQNSLFRSNGEEWKKQKKILRPAFQFAALERRFPIMNKHSRRLVEKLSSFGNNHSNDLLDILKDSTLRTILESYLDIDENFQKSSIIIENINRVTTIGPEVLLKPWLGLEFFRNFFREVRQCEKGIEELHVILKEILETIKKNMLESNIPASDRKAKLLGELLIKEHLQDASLTMDDVIGQLIPLIAAGFDTTAITLMWCLYLLGLHEEIQENVLSELEDLNEDICDEDMRKMEYTECVIKETMRLYATVPIFGRYLSKELHCGKYKIPKGLDLVVPLNVLHKNSSMYPDPEKFDPKRFSKKEDGSSAYFAPFAEGLRPCQGKRDAMSHLKIMIAHIIRNYKVVSLDKRKDVQVSWETVLHSAKPLRMQFIPRHPLSDDNAL